MEARKQYYTFGEALNKIQSDPEHLAMTRNKYYKAGYKIKEYLPSVDPDSVSSPVLVIEGEDASAVYAPSQEDLHAINWFILRKVESPKEEKKPEDTTSYDKEVVELLKRINNYLERVFNEK